MINSLLKKSLIKKLFIIAMAFQLNACASLDFLKMTSTPANIKAQSKLPAQWQAPLPQANQLPHQGEIHQLSQFWQQFDDALLIELIDAAQVVSADIASAKTRIASTRAARVSTVALTRPTLDGVFSTTRSLQQPASNVAGQNIGGQNITGQNFNGATNTTQLQLQSAWELDIFGANRILVDSAKKTEAAAVATWHDARVAVATELASSYFNQRFCQAQLAVLQSDLASRKETARVTAIGVKAGFNAPVAQYLADATVFDAQQQLTTQHAKCDLNIKELVLLTDIDEGVLRQKLSNRAFKTKAIGNKNVYTIDTVPATVIAQRPDILNAEAELMAAAANLQSKQAARYPRVTLNGSIGWMNLSSPGFSSNGQVWSLGPLSITLPLYDGGKRKAEINSADAQYSESAIQYRQKLRIAVKEVESALVDLHSAQQREQDLASALTQYQASFTATQAKVRGGFANLIELEISRRDALQTEINYLNLQQDRLNAWLALYRAAGGDWQQDAQNEAEKDKKNAQSI